MSNGWCRCPLNSIAGGILLLVDILDASAVDAGRRSILDPAFLHDNRGIRLLFNLGDGLKRVDRACHVDLSIFFRS